LVAYGQSGREDLNLARKTGTYAFIDCKRLVDYHDGMPRTARASVGAMCYYALDRGNRRDAVFHKPGDYDSFVKALMDAHARLPVDPVGYCVMPNHFHLVLRLHHDGDPGRWKQWLLTSMPGATIAVTAPQGTSGKPIQALSGSG
jgi:hypothetical protein